MKHARILPGAPSPAALAAMLLSYPREHLEALTEALIATLDVQDGDLDLEETDAEDSFLLSPVALDEGAGLPGCPISDPGGGNVEDEGEGIDEREEEQVEGPFCDTAAFNEQKRRIQLTRCWPQRRRWRDWYGREGVETVGYELLCEPKVPTRRQILKRKRGLPRRPRA